MFSKKSKNPEDCIDRGTLLSYVEGSLSPEQSDAVQSHVESCDLCGRFHGEVEGEIKSLSMSISLVWTEEGISCPHRDILKAYLAKSLSGGEADYVEFHLTEIACQFCNANLEDIRALDSEEESRYLDSVRERLNQSTSAFLRKN